MLQEFEQTFNFSLLDQITSYDDLQQYFLETQRTALCDKTPLPLDDKQLNRFLSDPAFKDWLFKMPIMARYTTI